jgi:hypothetical protein
MDISRFGQLYSMAAANMLTEMVLPNLPQARKKNRAFAC